MCSCLWHNVYYVHLLHPPCLLSAFVPSFSVYFEASSNKDSEPYSRSETDGSSEVLEFPLRMSVLGSLFVIRKAKVKTAVTENWISGFTEMAHTILFDYFFLYLVFSLCQSHIHGDINSQGFLTSVSFGDIQPFQWGCISLLHAEHAEAVVSWWCCLLWITSL